MDTDKGDTISADTHAQRQALEAALRELLAWRGISATPQEIRQAASNYERLASRALSR